MTPGKKDQLRAAFANGLLKLGFEKRKGLLCKRISGGALIRAGLNATRLRDGSVRSLVIVGVRFDDVYQEGLRLGAFPGSDGNLSLSSALGYLSNHDDGGAYYFGPEADSDDVAHTLLSELERFGLPAVSRLHSVRDALEIVVNNPSGPWSDVETFVPLAHWCLGDRKRALDEAMMSAEKMGLRGEGRRFKAFLEAMRGEMRPVQ